VVVDEESLTDDERRASPLAPWGRSTEFFHFATRTTETTRFGSDSDDRRRLREKLVVDPPPPAFCRFDDVNAVNLGTSSDRDALGEISLRKALEGRTSTRVFAPRELSVSSLGDVLDAAARLRTRSATTVLPDGSCFRTAPSGGARHPIELYVWGDRVSGLPPGLHHYNALDHRLELVTDDFDRGTLDDFCANPPWLANAACAVIYTAVVGRSTWKYTTGRSYRVLCMDLGHLSQSVYLACGALGLGVTFIGTVRDTVVERLVDRENARQFVMGASIIGALPKEKPQPTCSGGSP
jgi:SagB-type dehydrogenase family enzyme